MNYVKKMCILRQVKQGFSGDGKTLSGLVKLEQYGKNLAVEVSIINFAPLVMGEYYCLLCDLKGVCEILPLRGKSLFNIITDLDVSDGFCAVICFVKTELTPIAYGVNGKATYNWRAIVNALPFGHRYELYGRCRRFDRLGRIRTRLRWVRAGYRRISSRHGRIRSCYRRICARLR